jgi:hypothetical protein
MIFHNIENKLLKIKLRLSPWVSNFGHVTTKVNVHGQKRSAEVSFFRDYFSVQPI